MSQTQVNRTYASYLPGTWAKIGEPRMGGSYVMASNNAADNVIGGAACSLLPPLGDSSDVGERATVGGATRSEYLGILGGLHSYINNGIANNPLGINNTVKNGQFATIVSRGTINAILQTPGGESPPQQGYGIWFNTINGVLIAFDQGATPAGLNFAFAKVVTGAAPQLISANVYYAQIEINLTSLPATAFS